jgi:hypothetical protein
MPNFFFMHNIALEFPAYLFGISTDALSQKLLTRLVTTGGGAGKRSSAYDVNLNVDQVRCDKTGEKSPFFVAVVLLLTEFQF